MKTPTDTQRQYLVYIRDYTELHRCAPSETDMQQHFKVTPPTVHQMVVKLAENGFISRVPRAARSIKVLIDLPPAPKSIKGRHITRIFRVRIQRTLRAEFERQFLEISVPLVKAQAGCLSQLVGYPIKWRPDEYMLQTTWTNEAALIAFAGENWFKAVIPHGMEKYVVECWVDHFTTHQRNAP